MSEGPQHRVLSSLSFSSVPDTKRTRRSLQSAVGDPMISGQLADVVPW